MRVGVSVDVRGTCVRLSFYRQTIKPKQLTLLSNETVWTFAGTAAAKWMHVRECLIG